MPQVKTRDPAATRRQILEAARKVFVDKGFGIATTAEIAELAGVTKSLIHHYFGSKDGLWLAVKEEGFEAYGSVQHRMLEESEGTVELLRDSITTYFEFLRLNPDFVRLMGWVLLERRDGGEIGAGLIELGSRRIREAQDKGLLRDDVDPRHVLFVFLALCEHWFLAKELHCSSAEGGPPDDQRFHRDLQKIFFEGMLPR